MSVTLKSRDVSALARPGGVNRRSGLGQARASRCGVIRMRKAGNHLISIGRGWKLNPPNRRGTDPYARWCGRGGIARCPPIPIGSGLMQTAWTTWNGCGGLAASFVRPVVIREDGGLGTEGSCVLDAVAAHR